LFGQPNLRYPARAGDPGKRCRYCSATAAHGFAARKAFGDNVSRVVGARSILLTRCGAADGCGIWPCHPRRRRRPCGGGSPPPPEKGGHNWPAWEVRSQRRVRLCRRDKDRRLHDESAVRILGADPPRMAPSVEVQPQPHPRTERGDHRQTLTDTDPATSPRRRPGYWRPGEGPTNATRLRCPQLLPSGSPHVLDSDPEGSPIGSAVTTLPARVTGHEDCAG